jgi:hypothetical protein
MQNQMNTVPPDAFPRKPDLVRAGNARQLMTTLPLLLSLVALLTASLAGKGSMAGEPGSQQSSLPELQYVDRQSLPNFEIGGQVARIHTQGLFITDRYYYVSGRLERRPRRPLLVRFDRSNPAVVEHLDLLDAVGSTANEDRALDHPGGFDFDGEWFWIPLAVSRPNSQSLIVKVQPGRGQPLAKAKAKIAFRLDDHIGAIACDAANDRLFGANWDAKLLYVWKPDGKLIEKFAPTELLPKNAGRAFAIQDWKGLGDQQILAGAVDKSLRRPPMESKAVLQLIDMAGKRQAGLVRPKGPADRDVVLTQEGMAVTDDYVYFLPGDLGTGAELFRYRWSQPLRLMK